MFVGEEKEGKHRGSSLRRRLTDTLPGRQDGGQPGVWTSGVRLERSRRLRGDGEHCHHLRETVHLSNVPFPNWNRCNGAGVLGSPRVAAL